jgi:hypothetical protein
LLSRTTYTLKKPGRAKSHRLSLLHVIYRAFKETEN